MAFATAGYLFLQATKTYFSLYKKLSKFYGKGGILMTYGAGYK
jgi:hypothetical protein